MHSRGSLPLGAGWLSHMPLSLTDGSVLSPLPFSLLQLLSLRGQKPNHVNAERNPVGKLESSLGKEGMAGEGKSELICFILHSDKWTPQVKALHAMPGGSMESKPRLEIQRSG